MSVTEKFSAGAALACVAVGADRTFRDLLESAPDAMVIVNKAGEIVLVNAQTERLFCYPRAELLGQKVEILLPERYRHRHVGQRGGFFDYLRVRPMGAGLQLFGLHQDGTEFPVEISLSPVETEGGMLVSAAIRDITERKAVEDQLRRTADELGRSNADLEQFASIASHDLQEPLRAVSGFVALIEHDLEGKLDESTANYLRHVTEGALRMQTLIGDLLSYSRVRRSQEFTDTDSGRALGAALSDLSVAIRGSDARITSDQLPTLSADSAQLTQLFNNLIGNAIKFAGGRKPRAHVAANREDTAWHFTVKDEGIGIDPQFAERIFVIFQRLHTRKEYPGTGIGLAICKKIVERHGGRIWVESEPGNGSTFHFTIPDQKGDWS